MNSSHIDSTVPLFTNAQVRRYLGGALDERGAKQKLDSWINSKNSLYLTVSLLKNGEFVGIISVTDHHDGVYKELSYQLLPEYWGKGIAIETIEAVLEYLKSSNEIKEIVAETQVKNCDSCKLLEKLGFYLVDTVVRFGEKQNIYKKIL